MHFFELTKLFVKKDNVSFQLFFFFLLQVLFGACKPFMDFFELSELFVEGDNLFQRFCALKQSMIFLYFLCLASSCPATECLFMQFISLNLRKAKTLNSLQQSIHKDVNSGSNLKCDQDNYKCMVLYKQLCGERHASSI